ncbi:MAG TPA: hypothetical protein VFX30_01170 [bacterium]|nr:hypothetical protein [bacterium]
MYPIHCPIVVPPASGLVRLGTANASISSALNAFSNQASTGLAVPMISEDWERFSSVGLGSANPADVLQWMRRLSDGGEKETLWFREIESRVARELSASAKASSHTIDLHQVNRTRMAELTAKAAQRKSDSLGALKSRWYLAPMPRDQGQLFMNEDGRAIHLRSVTGGQVVLGYGWHTSAMHYLDLGNRPDVRSVGLFMSMEAQPSDLTQPWFASLVQSMMEFYSTTAFGAVDAKIVITGTDLKRAPLLLTGSWKDAGFVSRSFRVLSLSHDFTVETEDLVDGSRNPTFAGISPRVPQGQFRYAAAQGRIVSSFYRSKTSPTLGENGLPPEIRHRLIFPKPASRPPTRP